MLLTPFLQQCRERPDALALVEGDRRFSYGELLHEAQGIAETLGELGVGPGQRVAVHLERGIHAVCALFGVLLRGACYVPLDLKNPSARLAYIVQDAAVSAVVGHGHPPEWLEKSLWLNVSSSVDWNERQQIPAIGQESWNSLRTFQSTGHTLPPHQVEGLGEGDEKLSDLAMILYTSGSTGQPKGVALSHAAVNAFVQWAAELVNLQPEDRIASSAPLFFDLSTFDLYAVLGRGASLHFVPQNLTLAPAKLSLWLGDQGIRGWYTVPSLLAFLAYKGNLTQTPLASLRFIIFAGEVFPSPALTMLADLIPQADLYNFFGPTETNVCCYWQVDRQRLDAEQPIPIGYPAANDHLSIHHETGELWVRGPTLASGYWSAGRLMPFLNEAGWYATGDRVSLDGRGEFRFHGRLGRMLKCSGYRVEPAEIEAVLTAIAGVKESAVVGLADPAAGQRPGVLLALEPDATLGQVRQMLLSRLPAYMQPVRWLLAERVPRLGTGKIDYATAQAMLEAAIQ